MARITRFEEIDGWKAGRELCKLVYAATRQPRFAHDHGLSEQMRRAAVSVVSNIAEGFESQNNRVFVRYLYIAKASCAEVRSQAYVALDQDYVSPEGFDDIMGKATEAGRLIAGLITYLGQHLDR